MESPPRASRLVLRIFLSSPSRDLADTGRRSAISSAGRGTRRGRCPARLDRAGRGLRPLTGHGRLALWLCARRADAVADDALATTHGVGSIGTIAENLGELALRHSALAGARASCTQALQAFERIAIATMIAHIRGTPAATAGEVTHLEGEAQEAERCYQEAIALLEHAPNPWGCLLADRLAFLRERMALL